MPAPEVRFFEFDEFRFDVRGHELTRAGMRVALQPKAHDVLLLLLQRHGEVVTKGEFFQSVWPDAFVEDQSLTVQIHEIRSALGDDVKTQRYIRTVPKRGYRVVAPIREISAAETESLRVQETPAGGPVAGMEALSEPATWPPESPSKGHDFHMPDALPLAAAAQSSAVVQQMSFGVAQGRPFDAAHTESLDFAQDKPADVLRNRPRRRATWAVAIGGSIVVSMLIAHVELRPEGASPHIVGRAQLTNDHRWKDVRQPLIPDGRRILTRRLGETLSVERGTLVRVPELQGYLVWDVARDGSEYLATKSDDPGAEGGLWILSSDGTSRQRIGEIVADAASWSPDGRRIAYAREHGSVRGE